MNYNSKKVAIIGLGLEGKDLITYLQDKGAHVTLLDAKPESELDLTDVPDNLAIRSGESYLDSLEDFDVVFRSPGVYPLKPELNKARENGVVISSAIKLFFDECPAKIVGVTGTKGKGTTSSLIYDMMKRAKYDVYLAGNIGKPYLSLLSSLRHDSWIVLELSSFQLMDLTRSPHISVVLNISTDHLDWHKDRDEYLEAKRSIVCYQTSDDIKVVNNDYTDSRSFADIGKGRSIFFSTKEQTNGAYVRNDELILSLEDGDVSIGKTSKLLLRGKHNWENITASMAAASAAGVDTYSIKESVFSFKGLEHRLELVREFEGVTFYNDSFATGPDTVRAAANSFSEPLTLILGGFDKGLDYREMANDLAARPETNVVLIGDISHRIEKDLQNAHFQGQMKNLGKPSMHEIVQTAKQMTPSGGVVVLSPGSSSFDMFASYKERGNQFKECVLSMS